MDFLGSIEADDRDLEGLVDAISSLISRDVKDVAMLLRIAHVLVVEVPEELVQDRRAVKSRIIQFLNSDEIINTPGIYEILIKLQEDINLYLFPTDHSDSDAGDEAEENPGEEWPRKFIGGRGLMRPLDIGGPGRPSGRGGFPVMPKLDRRRSTMLKMQPKHRSTAVGGFGAASGAGGFGVPAGGADTFSNSRRSVNLGVGPIRGVSIGGVAGVGRGNGGVSSRSSNLRLSGRGRASSVGDVPAVVRRRTSPAMASSSARPVNPSVPVVPVAAHRLREFKIHGKIGEPPVDGVEPSGKDKDNLSYSNVMLQIQDGVVAGYEDREIVGAVVRATTDHSLRDFLVEQVMSGLNVEGLKEVLGTHFSVQNATGLYKQMLRRSQRKGESIQRFVQEMMKFRDQVLRLSAKEGGLYTPVLMQDAFQKGVYNGLRSSEARQALRVTLKRNDLDDFELRQEISELMLDEADHETLVGEEKPQSKPATKNAAVKQVSTKNPKNDPVMALVVQKLDEFKVGVTKDITDFKQDVLTKFVPATSSDLQGATAGNLGGYVAANQFPAASQLPGGNGGNLVGAHQFPQFQFAGGSNAGFDGSSGGGRGGQNGRGRGNRGGRGGARGRGTHNNNRGGLRHPLNRPVGICEICAAANALFCNHCLVCGNVDHLSYYCPERNNPAFQKPKN